MENCNKLVSQFLELCNKIGVPVALEKTEWATKIIVFLGLLLDGSKFVVAIPEDKRIKALNWIQSMISRHKSTVKELEKLTGLLNFLNRAVFPGCAFTRRMYAKFTRQTKDLKSHHHVTLDKEFKDDCRMWQSFLTDLNTYSVARPFIDHRLPEETAEQLFFFSDASANPDLGFRCIFGKSWLFSRWEKNFIQEKNPSIGFFELYALCMGVFTWSNRLKKP